MDPKFDKKWVKLSQIGMQMLFTVLIISLLGYKADKYFLSKTPWFTIAGLFLGCGIAFYNVIRQLPKE